MNFYPCHHLLSFIEWALLGFHSSLYMNEYAIHFKFGFTNLVFIEKVVDIITQTVHQKMDQLI